MASEQDELRAFLAERVRAFQPSIDVSEGSAADTEIIQPTLDRLAPDPFETPIEDFQRRRLASEFPGLIIGKGEPLDDLMVKPMRVLHDPFRRQITTIGNNQSIINPSILNEVEADRILANYFETRRLGGFAIGTAKIFFSQPRSVTLGPSNAVFTASGLRFFPVELQSLTAESMLFNNEGALFFFRVVVRAENEGTEYNIDPDTLIGVENFASAVKVSNDTRFEEGDTRESTEEFVGRVEGSLSEKSLVTSRGIRSRLFGLFDNVRAIGIVGFGDPEMDRDLVTGAPESNYAFGMFTASTGASTIALGGGGGVFVDDSGGADFTEANVAVGDVFSYLNLVAGTITDFTVTDLLGPFLVQVTPPPPNLVAPSPFWIKSKQRGRIFISDIPGGILVPQTPDGDIIVANRQVHIGGHDDVYIRGGFPQEQSINLSAIKDGAPLTLGIDLETFGADSAEFIQITPEITGAMTTLAADGAPFVGPGDPAAILIVKTFDPVSGTSPWVPSSEDIGRFVELLGPDFSLLQITAILQEAVVDGFRTRRVQVSTADNHTLGSITVADAGGTFAAGLDFRIVERVTVKPRVRDRSSPQVDFNGNSNGVGGEVGDSIVIETGADAGIFSIRRILTSIGEDDTLVLDRELTTTITPSGLGNGTGARYRLDDELQVDLITPKILKIPIGAIFPGGDLQTVAGSTTVLAGGTTNFLLAGVEIGDTLGILEGDDIGESEITDVQAGSLELATPVQNTGFNLDFEVFRGFDGVERPLVRVKSIELLDSSSQPTGITVPYGDVIDIRVLGTLANRAQGKNIESFKGTVILPDIFEDTSIDFTAQRVSRGDRLEIFEGDNIGEYEIEEVAPGSNDNRVRIVTSATVPGANDFVTADTTLHYQVGLPSAGRARLYFLEPTSVEIDTGLSGGRLDFVEDGQPLRFRYSQVQGRFILPAAGSTDDDVPRDIRVVRSYSVGGGQFETILEITDPNNPDAFELELTEGDLVELFEQIPFKNTAGLTFPEASVFGTPAGLRTISGSNRVSVPPNSRIDFTMMGDLEGQVLRINVGPDAGVHTVKQVIDAKTLELNSIMSATTLNTLGVELGTPLDATLVEDPPASGIVFLVDLTDSGQFGAVGDFVTIFEGAFAAVEGQFEIASVDLPANRIELTGFTVANIGGTFAWVITDPTTPAGLVEQTFSIYSAVPKETSVVQVATKAPDVVTLRTAGTIPGGVPPLLTLTDVPGTFTTTVRGDRLEVLEGPNAGVYPIFAVPGSDEITIYTAQPFATAEVGVTYRVWAGIHGARRMVTVAGFEGTDGLLEPGLLLPYQIRRAGVLRTSSTVMEDSEDNGLFFVDVDIESLGPGDNRNLAENTRMVAVGGIRVDGYTYSVENNVLTFSPFEEVTLNFDRRFLPVGNTDLPENLTEVNGRNLQIVYENSVVTRIINDFIRSDADRTVVADPIARHFLPSFIFTSLIYEGGSSDTIIGPEVETFINSLGSLDRLEVSDVEKFVQRRGATFIEHPINLVAVTHDIDRNLIVERSDNFIGGAAVPYNGSGRISAFFARLGEGLTVTRR